MPKRDPHEVLGVPRGASQSTIKAAWRRLAREHHPDLATGDPAAARTATRRMAEINQAYELLRVGAPGRAEPETDGRRVHWPPRAKPTRPVTGRVDTTATFRPRNTTTGPRSRPVGPPPYRPGPVEREAPRASTPTGPLVKGRQKGYRRPAMPSLAESLDRVVDFGKFHGHTLAEIAAFEPSYIDWLARTISRDPDLLAQARVVQQDLDDRGVARRPRPVHA